MKRNIIIQIISLLLMVVTLGFVVFAYYVDRKTSEPISFTVGEVSFGWDGSFVSGLVVPGQELIDTEFTLTNQSTIPTEIRLILTFSTSILGEVEIDEVFLVSINEEWELEIDGLYYYRGSITDSVSEPGKFKISPTETTPISVLTSLMMDGFKIKNEHKNETITLNLTFQAKQSDYVDWVILGTASYDFTTGKIGN